MKSELRTKLSPGVCIIHCAILLISNIHMLRNQGAETEVVLMPSNLLAKFLLSEPITYCSVLVSKVGMLLLGNTAIPFNQS